MLTREKHWNNGIMENAGTETTGHAPAKSLYLQKRYSDFLNTAIKSGHIFTLASDAGTAEITSGGAETDPILCFWAHPASAIMCRHQEWIEYEVLDIPVTNFIDRWCPGMDSDHVLIGANPDHNRDSLRLQPHRVARDLLQTAQRTGVELKIRDREYLRELQRQAA